ncbi:AraC family transcriptional regulator [Neisseria iguanae]|uniref:AraC family transcriptional regulator n=2 Tax=Neisseria iguanae TaxID=90242 RepID=A0A2P7TXW2_9NEIS|nr:AraC family transcriptional regulator [Neisseria iguanae]PSJ79535.1 AraC family transcriptional regulator [Neisseria iguanae]
MDILDKLITLAQVSGRVEAQCLFKGEWYVRHEMRCKQAMVHIVVKGEGYLKIDGQENIRALKSGDVVFFPHLSGHILSNHPQCCNPSAKVEVIPKKPVNLKRAGGSCADMHLFCMRFKYDEQADLLSNLPNEVFLNIADASLGKLIDILQCEAETAQYGGVAVINALAEILLVLLVRACLSQQQAKLNGLLGGWQDKRLQNLITAILNEPQQSWTVEEMAAAANLSRAQLMRLFKAKIGLSPHAFLNHIRLQQAAVKLRQSTDSILSVALSVGFQSETHFGRIFKKKYGISPGQYRCSNGNLVIDE